jgi:hypothetical protein
MTKVSKVKLDPTAMKMELRRQTKTKKRPMATYRLTSSGLAGEKWM